VGAAIGEGAVAAAELHAALANDTPLPQRPRSSEAERGTVDLVPPRHNIAPTQPVPVIILENGVRHFRLRRWSLLPGWVEDPRQFSLLFNACAETVMEKPAFKSA